MTCRAGIPIYFPTVISSLLKGQLRACYETFGPRNLSNVASSYPVERTCWQSKHQVHHTECICQSSVRPILNGQLRACYETFGPELLTLPAAASTRLRVVETVSSHHNRKIKLLIFPKITFRHFFVIFNTFSKRHTASLFSEKKFQISQNVSDLKILLKLWKLWKSLLPFFGYQVKTLLTRLHLLPNRLVTKRPAQLSCSEPPGTPSEPRSRIC